MLFNLLPAEQNALQRQLDADYYRFSRELQMQTDASFKAEELDSFRMTGLFDELPGNHSGPLPLQSSTSGG